MNPLDEMSYRPYPDEAEAREAAQRLLDWRHADGNQVVGGTPHIEVDDKGRAIVVASFRIHPDAGEDAVKALAKELQSDLLGGKKPSVTVEDVGFVDEQFVDDAGQVQTRPANRVVLSDTGETVVSKVRAVNATDPETGEVLGTVHLRTQHVQGADGELRKLEFPKADATGTADTAHVRDEVLVSHTPGK